MKNKPSDQRINLFMVGIVSTSAQLLLLREMINITGGYELITGTFLASWLIISSAGSALAGRLDTHIIPKLNIFFPFTVLISLILMIFLSRTLIITGQTPSFLISAFFIIIMIFPVCLVSGLLFVSLIRSADFSPGYSFSVETTGGIAAGVMISILTSGLLNTHQALLLVVILSATYSLINFLSLKKRIRLTIRVVAALLSSFVILFNVDIFVRQLLMPGIKVRETTDTPYGNITSGEINGERSVYYNHRLLTYKNDVSENEEDVHYALLQSSDPVSVAMVSGSLANHLPELLKYPLEKIIYIERDPFLVENERPPDSLSHLISFSSNDAFHAVRKFDDSVDAILILVPPPSNLMLNRYYTMEFFVSAKKKLKQGGIFMCSTGPSLNYYNSESLLMISSIYSGLKSVFKNVLPISGNKLYLLASDEQLSTSITRLSKDKLIENIYVSEDYLSDDLISNKSMDILSLMDSTARSNSLINPVAYSGHQSLILSMDPGEKSIAIIMLLALFVLPVMTIKRKNCVIYSAAIALAGFEIIQIFNLQMYSGNMYQLTGLLIAAMMAGLALGAGTELRFKGSSITLRGTGLILALFYLSSTMVWMFRMFPDNQTLITIIIIMMIFIPAYLTGHIFQLLTSGEQGKKFTAGTYSADLAGSALGFILTASVVIPLSGINLSGILLAIIIFTGSLLATIRLSGKL